MLIKKLIEILTLVRYVKTDRWHDVMKIVNFIKDGEVEIKEKKWGDDYKQNNLNYFPLDLSEIGNWSTTEGECIDIKFTFENNKLTCKVLIYESYSSYSGSRNKLKFSAVLILPISFILNLEHKINGALSVNAELAYENYLETQKQLWILNYINNIVEVGEEVNCS